MAFEINNQQNSYDPAWYEKGGSSLSQSIHSSVRWLQSNVQRARLDSFGLSAKLYSGGQSTLFLGSTSRLHESRPVFPDKVTFNLVSSTSDTIHSTAAQAKPLPLFYPTGGNYQTARKAKLLSKFVEGLFTQEKVWDLGATALLDAIALGMGIIKVFPDVASKRVMFERVLARDLLWDPIEAQGVRAPRSLHQTMLVSRAALANAFPKAELSLVSSTTTTDISRPVEVQSLSDEIFCIESWHLPSAPGAKDGIHTITIAGQTLLREMYEETDFPFAIVRFKPRLLGWDGQGTGELLSSLQLEANTILYVISKATKLAGTRKILVSNQSKVDAKQFTNAADAVIEYRGNIAPQYVVPQIVPPEVYAHLESLLAKGFKVLGVSEMTSQGVKPIGDLSGKALRTLIDVESGRMSQLLASYENLYLDLARLSVRIMRKNFEDGFAVKLPGHSFLGSIDWRRVNLEEDQYTLKLWPTNLMSRSPAARLQDIQDLLGAGFISQRQGQAMLRVPSDADAAQDFQSAAEDYCEHLISYIIDGDPNNKDEPTLLAVEPMDDLVMLRTKALETYNWARVNQVEEPKLELLRQLMLDIDALSQMALEQANAQAAVAQNAAAANSAPSPGQAAPTPLPTPQPQPGQPGMTQ